jgi:hypothetical protein
MERHKRKIGSTMVKVTVNSNLESEVIVGENVIHVGSDATYLDISSNIIALVERDTMEREN